MWPIGLALVLLAAEPFVGWLPVAAALGVLAIAVALARYAPWPRVALAGVGGMVAALSAVEALVRHEVQRG